MAEDRRWSRTNRLIIDAARRLGAQALALTETETDFFLNLRSAERSVIISKTRSPYLTQLAQTLSNNKRVCRELLGAHGIAVLPDRLVDDGRTIEEAGAEAFLAEHRALTVKPNWGNRAAGLTVRVQDAATLRRAVERAQTVDRDEEALIQPYLPGTNLRVAVIGGRVEAVAEIRRPWLRGDGQRSARELLAAHNQDARRAPWQTSGPSSELLSLDRIPVDESLCEHLEVYGLGVDEPLPAGFELEVLTEELEVIDLTDALHPGWREVARRACALLGVDVGGVDLRGPREAFFEAPTAGPEAWRQGALLEINVLPALHLHALPTQGTSRPVFEAFVAYCLALPGAPAPVGPVDAVRLLPS